MKRYIAKSILVLLIIQSFQAVASVDWQPWSKKSFARAEAENKLILINVGMEGCTACNRMEEYTYSNKEVAELLNKHFISIAVDSQARPDVGERYSDWAWPATAFLIPDGTQIFGMAGNRFPESFLPILNDLIKKHKYGVLRADPNSPYKQQVKPVTTPITKVRDGLRSTIDSQLNVSIGGWSEWGLNAETDGARLEHLYMRAHLNKDEKMKAIALAISAKFIETIDPVWGGAYESLVSVGAANVPEEFSKLRAVPEKRITNKDKSRDSRDIIQLLNEPDLTSSIGNK